MIFRIDHRDKRVAISGVFFVMEQTERMPVPVRLVFLKTALPANPAIPILNVNVIQKVRAVRAADIMRGIMVVAKVWVMQIPSAEGTEVEEE